MNIDTQGIELAHILAMSSNNCIGKDNDLPWHISADLQHFKKLTQGGVMVLGRKCYDSFGGRPLPKRSHWVVTRNTEWDSGYTNTENTSVQAVHDLQTAIEKAIAEAKAKDIPRVWIIGGGDIYKQTLPLVSRLEITHIEKEVDGDTFYPQLSDEFLAGFDVQAQPTVTDENSGLDYRFVSYTKK